MRIDLIQEKHLKQEIYSTKNPTANEKKKETKIFLNNGWIPHGRKLNT